MAKREIKSYSTINKAVLTGHPTQHQPRQNYWGNLHEEDTYDEELSLPQNYHYSDFDPEDDHSSFYDSYGYD